MTDLGAAVAADDGAAHRVSRAGGAGAIHKIAISGFRTVASTELRVGPVTALVGEASAGKSNLLSAIALLGGIGRPEPTTSDATTGGTISVEATTSAGRVAVSYDQGVATRQRSWPIAVLPSGLRDTSIVASASEADAAVTAVVEAISDQARHATSPSGRAGELVAGLERCCELELSGVLLLVEEPELYLRPQAQRYLYRLLHEFADRGNQVMYSTHAPAFLNVGRLDELAIVTRHPRDGTTVHQTDALSAPDGFRAMSEFDAERGELFLADVAILVEGRTEKLALPHVFRAAGVDVDRAGISIVECGGKANLPIFVRLCRATGVPFVVVHDRDAAPNAQPIPSERRLNGVLQSLAGDHVVELAPDFEAVVGLRRRSRKPEQAWDHFRTLAPGDVPPDLRRVVDLVSHAQGLHGGKHS